ncbi:hypothetical protein MSG28_005343 [Choristoneura fumiferana]|uniref:Uncharacterized protein n=1 Tax=Choristoneura fumiferana TaxID=7141 RepID=A0ACC0JQU3_CHOFU|nr:hypothetical protein MSG28_005343 [Choristoneura fumiferana]
MVARVAGVFDEKLTGEIANSKILVVGAGGIGCEILKNLVLTGFPYIEIIDLDTIDVSNLNRQFLFHKEHVGKSKAQVAKDSALSFNPNVNIIAHHDSVISNDYSVSYFKQFNIVMNALDNRVARNHVNRMCLAAKVPLIETGTAGYAGQCYECQPKAPQKSFPGCTIRNTPSEPIHCIVWAKHLFNQLFGEEDPDQDVSPDTADPEAAGDAGSSALTSEGTSAGNVERKSTRTWAAETNYDPEKLFSKLFGDDIRYLLSMENLWKKRRPPTPLAWDALPGKDEAVAQHSGLPDQRVWSVHECAQVFAAACKSLQAELAARPPGDHLVWDKDDKSAMDFVTACSNVRAHIFNIPLKSRFEIKSMAGNIIPAIATANAIVAGLAVLRAQAVLSGDIESCSSVYLRPKVNHRGQLFVPEKTLTPPNPKCYVCAEKPEVSLACNLKQLTLKELNTAFKDGLNMQAPDATVEGKGLIVLSSEPGETDHNNDKTLEEIGLNDGCALLVDDFLQNYEVRVRLQQEDEEKAWRLVTDADEPMPAPKAEEKANGSNGSEPKPGPSRSKEDSDSDMEIIEEDDGSEPAVKPPKRRRTEMSDEVVELCYFPKLCGSQRATIEKYLCHFLEASNYNTVVEAAKCAHALQQVRPGQEKSSTPKVCWRDLMCALSYSSLRLWLTALRSHRAPPSRGRDWQDELTQHVARDVTPAAHTVQLTAFHELLVRESFQLDNYSNNRGYALLQALEASRKTAPPGVPPPTQYCLQLYSALLTSPHPEVSRTIPTKINEVEIIPIIEEPANKKPRLEEEISDKISLHSSSGNSVEICYTDSDNEVEEVSITHEISAEIHNSSNETEEINEKSNIHDAVTQMPQLVSNDTIDGTASPESMEVVYGNPNTGTERVTVLEKLDDENLPSTNDTDDVQITCGQMIKSLDDDPKLDNDVNEQVKLNESQSCEPKVNGIKSPEKVEADVVEGSVTVKIAANNEGVSVEDMLADFVDEVNDDNLTKA